MPVSRFPAFVSALLLLILTAGPAAALDAEFNDGTVFRMGPASQARLDQAAVASTAPGAVDTAVGDDGAAPPALSIDGCGG